MENSNNTFLEKYAPIFKNAYSVAFEKVQHRENEKMKTFQTKDYHFLAANLSNFAPQVSPEKYNDIYLKIMTNHLLSGTSFRYVDLGSLEYLQIEGNKEWLETNIRKPKIFCTYHLGGYRGVFAMILAAGYDLALVIDSKTYHSQKEVINQSLININTYKNQNVRLKILIAEDSQIGKNMAEAILQGYSIMIFLDGNTGTGGLYHRGATQLKIPFLNSEIYTRTGIATLSHTLKVPIVPIISYYSQIHEVDVPIYHCDNPIIPHEYAQLNRQEYVEQITKKLYKLLESFLEKYIDQWESWFYFHKFLDFEYLNLLEKKYTEIPQNDSIKEEYTFNNQDFGLFKLHDECFVVNKKTYKGYPLDLETFSLLVACVGSAKSVRSLENQIGADLLAEMARRKILV